MREKKRALNTKRVEKQNTVSINGQSKRPLNYLFLKSAIFMIGAVKMGKRSAFESPLIQHFHGT